MSIILITVISTSDVMMPKLNTVEKTFENAKEAVKIKPLYEGQTLSTMIERKTIKKNGRY